MCSEAAKLCLHTTVRFRPSSVLPSRIAVVMKPRYEAILHPEDQRSLGGITSKLLFFHTHSSAHMLLR